MSPAITTTYVQLGRSAAKRGRQGLDDFGQMHALEGQVEQVSAGQSRAYRDEHLRPVLKACKDWLLEQRREVIPKLRLFALQADETWSFAQKKAFKRWIWVAFEPVHRVVIIYHIGGHGDKDASAFLAKIPRRSRNCCLETDYRSSYKKIFTKHRVGKEFTYHIEGLFATVRARVSRLVRKSLSFSKSTTWHEKAIGYFF